MENYFIELNNVNVSDKIEKKDKLSYLSWAWAWCEMKKKHASASYTVYENLQGWNYFTDGKTCWVKTGVTVNGIEHIEYLPVMDFRNKSIVLEAVTSFEVNKAIQRSLTKACARHGLGLYIYAGEDLPEIETEQSANEAKEPVKEKIIQPTAEQLDKLMKLGGTVQKVATYFKVSIEEVTSEMVETLIASKEKALAKKAEAANDK